MNNNKLGKYIKCKNCSNKFYQFPSGKRIFCSSKCQYEYRTVVGNKKTICEGCGKINGFNILRFKGSEINKNIYNVINKISNAVNN